MKHLNIIVLVLFLIVTFAFTTAVLAQDDGGFPEGVCESELLALEVVESSRPDFRQKVFAVAACYVVYTVEQLSTGTNIGTSELKTVLLTYDGEPVNAINSRIYRRVQSNLFVVTTALLSSDNFLAFAKEDARGYWTVTNGSEAFKGFSDPVIEAILLDFGVDGESNYEFILVRHNGFAANDLFVINLSSEHLDVTRLGTYYFADLDGIQVEDACFRGTTHAYGEVIDRSICPVVYRTLNQQDKIEVLVTDREKEQ